MAININPNRINVGSGLAGKTAARGQQGQASGTQNARNIIPLRAALNNIPSPETLNTMIRSAVAALRDGTFWDRGTILNLVA